MPFVDQVFQDVVHECLEGGRRVGESKEHDGWLIQAPVGPESSLPLVSFSNADVIVSPSCIKFGKTCGVFEFVDKLWDQWQWVLVLYSHAVKFPIILYRS